MLSDAPRSVPLPGGLKIETPEEPSSPTSVVGTSPSDVHVDQCPDSDI